MGNPRARYTQEFLLEAVWMDRGGQNMAAVAKILGIWPKQTLHYWVKADAAGKLNGAGKPVYAEQMECPAARGVGTRQGGSRQKTTSYFAKVSPRITSGSSFKADNDRCPRPATRGVLAPAVTTRAKRVMSILPGRADASVDALPVHIKAVHAQSKGLYGWPRAWKQLLAPGSFVSARILSSGS